MPKRHRTKKTTTKKRGGSISSSTIRKIIGVNPKAYGRGKKNKIWTAEDHARFRNRKRDPTAKFFNKNKYWYPTPLVDLPHKPRMGAKRGGYVGLAKMAAGYIPDVYRLAASGVGSQGGNSAGSKAARMKYGAPLLSRYR